MEIKAICPWFGSNRMLAKEVGKLMGVSSWVGIPFSGSMAEIPHIKASTIVVADLHGDVINLASVMAGETSGPKLIRELRRAVFHETTLLNSQKFLADASVGMKEIDPPSWKYFRAYHYFIACWMGRSGRAGTKSELTGSLSTRWTATGGDSAIRFYNAVESIRSWRNELRRCTFLVQDCFELLSNVYDKKGHGIYCDPPFPGPGDAYKHRFSEEQHKRLAGKLSGFEKTRVVCRFYDHPLVRGLYKEGWIWHHQEGGRKQTNESAPEVLLVRNP